MTRPLELAGVETTRPLCLDLLVFFFGWSLSVAPLLQLILRADPDLSYRLAVCAAQELALALCVVANEGAVSCGCFCYIGLPYRFLSL